MVIDAHLHVWRAMPDYSSPSTTIVSPQSEVPIELLQQYMAEYEVDRAVLVQPLYPGDDNSYVADCAAADPQRFAAVCVVDAQRPDAVDRLDYWTTERGCKGLRLRPRMPQEAAQFGDPLTYPLWELASKRGIVINVLANVEHMPTLATLAERFPDVAIIVDHFAHPAIATGVGSDHFQALLALSSYPRVFVKPTGYYYFSRQAYPYADCAPFFREIYDHFGPTRLIWGSDFPHVLLKSGYRRNLLLQQRAYPFVSPDELELIMGRNAAQLYWDA